MRIIADIISTEKFWKVANNEIFLQGPLLRYQPYRSTYLIQDLSNAFKSGQSCPAFSLQYPHEDNWRELVQDVDGDMGELLARLMDQTADKGGIALPIAHGITVHRRSIPGVNTFSPFHLNRFKPLPAEPAKWTLAHMKRALANGQYEDLRCDGVYTDDYARDAERNYEVGPLKAMELLRNLIESSSGWRTYAANGRVHVNCHHFDLNSFRLNLENRTPALEAEILD